MVAVTLLGEGDGEVLDAVGCTEAHQDFEELFELFDEEIIVFVGFDIAQENYVVEVVECAIGLRQNDDCGGECWGVRGETDAIVVLLVGQS